MRPVANQFGVSPLVTKDLKLSKGSLAGDGSLLRNDIQRKALGHRQDDLKGTATCLQVGHRRCSLRAASRPNGRHLWRPPEQNDFEDAPHGDRQQYHQ